MDPEYNLASHHDDGEGSHFEHNPESQHDDGGATHPENNPASHYGDDGLSGSEDNAAGRFEAAGARDLGERTISTRSVTPEEFVRTNPLVRDYVLVLESLQLGPVDELVAASLQARLHKCLGVGCLEPRLDEGLPVEWLEPCLDDGLAVGQGRRVEEAVDEALVRDGVEIDGPELDEPEIDGLGHVRWVDGPMDDGQVELGEEPATGCLRQESARLSGWLLPPQPPQPRQLLQQPLRQALQQVLQQVFQSALQRALYPGESQGTSLRE